MFGSEQNLKIHPLGYVLQPIQLTNNELIMYVLSVPATELQKDLPMVYQWLDRGINLNIGGMFSLQADKYLCVMNKSRNGHIGRSTYFLMDLVIRYILGKPALIASAPAQSACSMNQKQSQCSPVSWCSVHIYSRKCSIEFAPAGMGLPSFCAVRNGDWL